MQEMNEVTELTKLHNGMYACIIIMYYAPWNVNWEYMIDWHFCELKQMPSRESVKKEPKNGLTALASYIQSRQIF